MTTTPNSGNSLNKLDSEANADNRASDALSGIAARLDALDARVSSVERLLLRLLAGQGGGGKKES